MRMWMVNPEYMCRQHLLGEHLELHMFVTSINKKMKLTGFVKNNLLEVSSLKSRHEELVNEMERRGYKHKTPLIDFDASYLGDLSLQKINISQSEKDLFGRCDSCKKLGLGASNLKNEMLKQINLLNSLNPNLKDRIGIKILSPQYTQSPVYVFESTKRKKGDTDKDRVDYTIQFFNAITNIFPCQKIYLYNSKSVNYFEEKILSFDETECFTLKAVCEHSRLLIEEYASKVVLNSI